MRGRQRVAAWLMPRLQPADRGGECSAARNDAERRRIDPADLLGIGIDVNQRLFRLRNVEQAVA
jgi:hypothetical protein